jgi:YHS domain-containing protein
MARNPSDASANPIFSEKPMPIDPVCKRHVEIADAYASYDYHSWTVYFDSLDCLRKFEEDPETYMDNLDDDEQIAA